MFFLLLLSDFPFLKDLSIVSQANFMKLFTHINDNILHQATLAEF